jgi:hypothetical protein
MESAGFLGGMSYPVEWVKPQFVAPETAAGLKSGGWLHWVVNYANFF